MSNSYGGAGVSLNYRGTNATQPPNYTFAKTNPTSSSKGGVSLGDLWLNTATQALFVLTSLEGTLTSGGMVATWTEVTLGPSGTIGQIDADFGNARPASGIINIIGGDNITTAGSGDTISIDLFGTTNHAVQIGNVSGSLTSLALGTAGQVLTSNGAGANPSFQAAGGGGITTLDGNVGSATGATVTLQGTTGLSGGSVTFIASGAQVSLSLSDAEASTYLGTNAGNSTATAVVGSNVGIGQTSLNFLTIGGANSACGSGSLGLITSGNYNSALGYNAGGNYTTSESSNISIGYNATGTTGESHTLTVGAGTGTGNGQLNKSIIHGISGATVASSLPVFINSSTGQLGTTPSASVSPGFTAVLSATTGGVTGNGGSYTLVADTVLTDRGTNYNNGTGVFTAPKTGFYNLWTFATVVNTTIASFIQMEIVTTANSYLNRQDRAASNLQLYITLSVVAFMNAGDTAHVVISVQGEAGDTNEVYGDGSTLGTVFGGVFIS